MSRNKAIRFDGVSDNFIRNCKNILIFCDIWKQSTIETNYACCRARLVPLNKIFPDIPTKTQFRPITILSPLFKLLELRFLPKLQQYLSTRLTKGQAGFIPGSSTQINIIRLLNTLTGYKKQDKMDCIFIDFSNAFNSINRQRLFNIVSSKSILDGIEVKFLNHLYTNLHYICPQMNTTFYFQNGVPQGSPLSPALFNIYLEDFLASLKQNCNFNYTSYEFANDIVIIIAHRNIQSFLQQLVLISEEYELRLNQKKCGIFFIQNHKRCQYNNIQGFPIVKSYKYLGINILNNGKINLQLDKVESCYGFLKNLTGNRNINYSKLFSFHTYFIFVLQSQPRNTETYFNAYKIIQIQLQEGLWISQMLTQRVFRSDITSSRTSYSKAYQQGYQQDEQRKLWLNDFYQQLFQLDRRNELKFNLQISPQQFQLAVLPLPKNLQDPLMQSFIPSYNKFPFQFPYFRVFNKLKRHLQQQLVNTITKKLMQQIGKKQLQSFQLTD